MNNVASYLSNVTKSIAYSSIDIMKEYNTTLASGLETNANLFKEIYSSVRQYKNTYRRVGNMFKGSKVYEASDLLRKSVFEDLASGKFYNKEREDQINTRAMGNLGDFSAFDDMDIEFNDGGDDDWNLDDSWEMDENTSALDTSIRESALNTSNTIAKTGQYIVESNKISNSLLYSQNVQMINRVSQGMGLVSSDLNKLNNFNESVIKTHAENSKTFYEQMTKLMTEQIGISKEALEMNRNLYSREQKKENPNKSLQFDDVVDAEGMPDLTKYAQVVKKNVKNIMGANGDMLFGDTMGEGSNVLLTFAANPLKFIPNYIINSFIPNSLKKTMDDFNKSLSGAFGAIVARLNFMAKDDDSNMFMKKVGEVFGIRNSLSSSIDTSKYDKEAIPFDGVAKKSLIEVIPGHLSRIESLLSGKSERVYDYKKGKWIDMENLKKDYENIEKNSVSSSTMDMKEYINKFMDQVSFESKEAQKGFVDSTQKILTQIYKDGGDFQPNSKDEYKYLNYGVSEKEYKQFRALWDSMPNNIRMNMASNMIRGRANQNKQMNEIETSGMSPYVEMFNNSNRFIVDKKKKLPTGMTGDGNVLQDNNMMKLEDRSGRNIFYYLKNLLKEAMAIRDNTSKIQGPDNTRILTSPLPTSNLPPVYTRNNPRPTSNIGGRISSLSATSSGPILNQNGAPIRSTSSTTDRLSTHDLDDRVNLPDDPSKRRTPEEERYRIKQLEETRFQEREKGRSERNPNLFRYDNMPLDESGFLSTFSDHARIIRNITDNREIQELDEESGWLAKELEKQANASKDRLKGNQIDPKSNLFDRLLAADSLTQKWDVINSSLSDISKKPADFLVSTINKVDQRLYTLIYGDPNRRDKEGRPIKGFLDEMIFGMQNTFRKFSNWMQDNILDPLKDKLDIEAFADLPKKILGFFGIDIDDLKKRAKSKLFGDKDEYGNRVSDGVLTPYTEAIKGKFTGLWDDTKGAIRDTYGAALDTALGEERLHGKDRSGQVGSLEHTRLFSTNPVQAYNNVVGLDREDTEENKKAYNERFTSRQDMANIFKGDTGRITDRDKARKAHEEDLAYNKENGINIIGEYAKGSRYITKSGLTAISEGEMIIPSELNPLNPNRFNVNKKQEIANERGIKNKFSKNLSNKIFNNIRENATADETIDIINTADEELNRNRAGEEIVPTPPVPDASETPFGKQVIDEFRSGYTYTRDRLFGSDEPKQQKTEQDALQKVVSDVTHNIKEYAPEAVASGLLGAGISLVTGAFGGPLIGAAAGVAMGLAKKSKVIQDMLFGEIGEDGNRKGALISKEMQQGFKKYFPDMKTLGLAGAVTGLFTPFGLTGGLMIGAAMGFAKNNDYIKETLFGKENGLIDGNMQERIKKAYPKIAAGTVATMFLGPFGLLGNAVLGAGLGYASSTDTFKNAIFGEETDEFDKNGKRVRKGGLLGVLKTSVIDPLKDFATDAKQGLKDFFERDIINPLKNFISPAGNEIKIFFQNLLGLAGSALSAVFDRRMGIPIETFIKEKLVDPLTKFTKFVFKTALAPTKFVVSAPFRALGAIGNTLKQKQIMRGQANYMTAADRLQFRQDHKVRGGMARVRRLGMDGDKALEMDETLATMSKEDIGSLMDSIGQVRYGKQYLNEEDKKVQKEIVKEVMKVFNNKRNHGMFSGKTRKLILKAIDSGDLQQAEYLLRTGRNAEGNRLTTDEQKTLSESLKEKGARLQNIKDRKMNSTLTRQDLIQNMRDKGFKNIKDKDLSLSRFNDLLKTEYNDRSKKEAYDKLSEEDVTFKDIGTIITDVYSQKTDELKEVMSQAALTLREIYTAIKQEGTLTPSDTPTEDIGLLPQQIRGRDRREADRESMANDLIARREVEIQATKLKLGSHYSDEQIESMTDNLERNPEISKLIISRMNKFPFDSDAVNSLYELSKKTIKRVEFVSKFMVVDSKIIELIKHASKVQYANIKAFLNAKYKIKNADDFKTIMNLKEAQKKKALDLFKKGKGFNLSLDQLINIPVGQYQIIRRDPKTFMPRVNEAIAARQSQENTEEPVEQPPDQSTEVETNYAGALRVPNNALSAISAGEMVVPKEDNDGGLQNLLRRASDESKVAQQTNDSMAETETAQLQTQNTISSTLMKILSKITGLLGLNNRITTEYGTMQTRETTDGQTEFANDSETTSVREKIEDRDNVQRGILGRLGDFAGSVGGFLKNLSPFGKEDKEKKSLLDTVMGFFKSTAKTALATAGTLGIIGALPYVYKWAEQYIFPSLSNWWTNSVIPTIAPIAISVSKGIDDTLTTIISWLGGTGKYNGGGFPGMMMNTVIPFYGENLFNLAQSLFTKFLPAVLRAIPEIVKGSVSGIKGLLSMSMEDIFGGDTKSEKYKNEHSPFNSEDGGFFERTMRDALGPSAAQAAEPIPDPPPYVYDPNLTPEENEEQEKDQKIGFFASLRNKMTANDPNYVSNEELEHLVRNDININDYLAGRQQTQQQQNPYDPYATPDNPYTPENPDTQYNPLYDESLSGEEKAAAVSSNMNDMIGTDGKHTIFETGAEAVARGTLTSAGQMKHIQNMGNGRIAKAVGNIPILGLPAKMVNTAFKPLGYIIKKTSGLSSRYLPTALTGMTRTVAEETTQTGIKGAVQKFVKAIPEKLGKMFQNSTIKSMLSKAIEKTGKKISNSALNTIIQQMIEKLSKTIIGQIAKSGAKVATRIAGIVGTVGWATVAFAVMDFHRGYKEANTLLGITEQPSFIMRVLCGIVTAINGFVTLGILPEEWLFTLVFSLAPIIGIDTSEILGEREAAKEEVEAYNAENGTELSLRQYNEIKNPSLIQKVKNTASSVMDWGKETASNIGEGIGKTATAAKEVWGIQAEKVGAGFNSAVDWTKNTASNIGTGIKNTYTATKDVWNQQTDKLAQGAKEAWNNTATAFTETSTNIGAFWNKSVDGFKNTWKDSWTTISDTAINIKDKATGSLKVLGEKSTESWTKFNDKLSENVGSMIDSISGLVKDLKDSFKKGIDVVNKRLGAMLGFKDNAGNDLSLSEGISYKWDNAKESWNSGWNNIKETSSEIYNNGVNWINSKIGFGPGYKEIDADNIFDQYDKMYGKTKDAVGGFGKEDHMSQRDSSVSGMSYNRKDDSVKQTVKDSGCGPVAATEVINGLAGKNTIGVRDAVDYSLNNGFKQKDGGTIPDYFNSIFSKYNIPSKQTNSRNDIVQNLSSGNPVVLLGQDKEKAGSSPFGKNSHYVIASGIDKNGNAIIQDPDSTMGDTKYRLNNVLNKSITGIAVDSNSGYGNNIDNLNAMFNKRVNSAIKPPESKKSPSSNSGPINPITVVVPALSLMDMATKPLNPNLYESYKNNKNEQPSKLQKNITTALPAPPSNTKASTSTSTSSSGYVPPADYVGDPTNPNDIIHQNLGFFSPVSVQEIDAWIDRMTRTKINSLMKGMGKVFVEMGNATGLDPRYLVAHAGWESAWGTSPIVRKKYNFFGIAAYDSSPMASAYQYDGAVMGIKVGSAWIRQKYYDERKKTTLFLMSQSPNAYATDPNWRNGIASIMAGGPVNTNRVYDQTSLSSADSVAMANASNASNGSTGVVGKATSGIASIFDYINSKTMGLMDKMYGADMVDAVTGIDRTAQASSGMAMNADGSPNTSSGLPSIGNLGAVTSADKFFLKNLSPGASITSKWRAGRDSGSHDGIDYGAPANTPIPSPINGVVSLVEHRTDSYGNNVRIKDKNNNTHIFAHMTSTIAKMGSQVKRGDILGRVGSTGNSSGNHLHYEVRSGNKAVDPNKYLATYGGGLGTFNAPTMNSIDYKSAPLIDIKSEKELERNYINDARTKNSTNNTTGIGGNDTIDYTEFIKAIIEVLDTIAVNTDNLSTIVKLLNDKFDLGISKDQLKSSTSTKSTMDKLKSTLQKQQSQTSGSKNGLGTMVMDKSTQYILSTMSALAVE